jgi:hypothetical protein
MATTGFTIWNGNGIGLVFSTKGLKVIGPCDPELLAKLKAISAAQKAQSPEVAAEAAAYTARLGRQVAAATQKLVGTEQLNAESGVVFFDADGGFTCGSTGKPPIPIPSARRIAIPQPVAG